MDMFAIVIPDTKPATEYVDGTLVQKVSPKRRHALLQKRLMFAFTAWPQSPGEALPEWRFNFVAPGERFGSLVPDVAILSDAVVAQLGDERAEEPPIAPEIAIEILSADERPGVVAWKTEQYLLGGTRLVINVDAVRCNVSIHTIDGVAVFERDDLLEHEQLPGLRLPLVELFAGL